MAKDLVRTRRYIKKFIIMKANIQAVSLKVQTLKSQDAMAQVWFSMFCSLLVVVRSHYCQVFGTF